jgi:hypothetical protein
MRLTKKHLLGLARVAALSVMLSAFGGSDEAPGNLRLPAQASRPQALAAADAAPAAAPVGNGLYAYGPTTAFPHQSTRSTNYWVDVIFKPSLAQTKAYRIWPATAKPVVPTNDWGPRSVNLGLRSKSDLDGYITAIRFYNGTYHTGTHVGSLWALGGELLASATFTNETAPGWQQVKFAAPVAISANID